MSRIISNPPDADSRGRLLKHSRLSAQLQFGGDYNPEQWDPSVWDEDVQLMQRAGVTLATVGVFAWSLLEPRPGEYEWGWLDDVLGRLYRGGIHVLLATATASPPPWLAKLHPESLPVTSDGTRLGVGSRQQYSPSSMAYREHSFRLVEQVATRYGSNPAVAAWHVNNEYGCHVARSYDDESARAFRSWLASRYSTVDNLNRAWGTAFWSQRYDSFDEIEPPRSAPAFANPTQLIDFDRFSSDALLDLYLAEVAILRRITPDLPITTNFMGFAPSTDYWKWADHVDVIADDSYPDPTDPEAYVGLAAQRDLMRSLGKGSPWWLMESATSAVQWRPVNPPKPRGSYRTDSLQAVARGADAILHFQWRQSAAGAEKFHSAMVPHAGPESRIFGEVCELSTELQKLAPQLLGQPVPAEVAIILDWDSLLAVGQAATPVAADYTQHLLAWYRAFLRRGVTVDFVPTDADLAKYSLVVAPMLYVAPAESLNMLDEYVATGGHLVVGYQSAVVDQDLHAWLGGYLGPLQRTLGIRVEEFVPLIGTDRAVNLGVTALTGSFAGRGSRWQDVVRVDHAEVMATFADQFAAGSPAITRRAHGAGTAWYVATLPDEALFDDLVVAWTGEASVVPLITAPTAGVEVVQRGNIVTVINHTDEMKHVATTLGQFSLGPFDVRFELQ